MNIILMIISFIMIVAILAAGWHHLLIMVGLVGILAATMSLSAAIFK